MVKPSKSMQPEHVDLVEAGRKVGTGRAFGEDSFHNYMALKIARQREQFGLVLPPLPKTIEKQIETTKLAAEISVEERSSTDRKVRFTEKEDATNVDDDDNRSPGNLELTSNKRTRMESIISRLKRRHGRGRQGSARKKRRKEQDDKKATRDNTKTRSYPSISVEGQREEVEDGISELARLFALDNDNTRSSNSNDDVQNNIENCSEQMKLSEKSNMDRLAVIEDRTPTKVLGASLMKSPSPKSIRKSRPDLFFYGVVVKVSGYTNPDNETIKRLLQKYGGDYETYETERVTHIIAEQLSVSQVNSRVYKDIIFPFVVILFFSLFVFPILFLPYLKLTIITRWPKLMLIRKENVHGQFVAQHGSLTVSTKENYYHSQVIFSLKTVISSKGKYRACSNKNDKICHRKIMQRKLMEKIRERLLNHALAINQTHILKGQLELLKIRK